MQPWADGPTRGWERVLGVTKDARDRLWPPCNLSAGDKWDQGHSAFQGLSPTRPTSSHMLFTGETHCLAGGEANCTQRSAGGNGVKKHHVSESHQCGALQAASTPSSQWAGHGGSQGWLPCATVPRPRPAGPLGPQPSAAPFLIRG